MTRYVVLFIRSLFLLWSSGLLLRVMLMDLSLVSSMGTPHFMLVSDLSGVCIFLYVAFSYL